ncbi:MAG TPA: Wzz/FepE/Etk N-terminal domain-containing protein [Gaiellaceae bacterium]|nr:Wzz/FepE/Etk N-terminal domain-containing protein [Gaiellaceae bacterium]
MTAPAPPQRGFDPEAEQEVDFARYVRLLAVRWWLLAAGVVAGAVIGYLVSLGGTQVYKAMATVYLGQPYTASGNTPALGIQTNPAAVSQVIHSALVDGIVARKCKTTASQFRKGISTAVVSGSSVPKTNTNPLVTITVQTRHAKVAECAANGLANEVVIRLGKYADGKIANLKKEIAADTAAITEAQNSLTSPSVSVTNKLLLQTALHTNQQDLITATQFLQQAKQIERPQVMLGAAAQRITARSRRNTVVVGALIGLILGALAALLWDTVVPRLTPRNGE